MLRNPVVLHVKLGEWEKQVELWHFHVLYM